LLAANVELPLFENLAGTTCEIVSNDLLPFLVEQSHDSSTLLSVKDVIVFSTLAAGH
jgi:hypothetical protein